MSLSKWEIPFRNDSSETVPAFGIIRVTEVVPPSGSSSWMFVTANKPNTYGSQYSHYINGPVAVAAGKLGTCTNVFPCLVKCGAGTPGFGQVVGPRNDAWTAEVETGGFIVVGTHSSGIVIVERFPMLAFTGRFDSAVTQDDTETVSVYWQGSDTTQNISGVYAVSGDFATTDDVNVSWMNERWEAYCR